MIIYFAEENFPKCAQKILNMCCSKILKMGKNSTRNALVLFHKLIMNRRIVVAPKDYTILQAENTY